MATKLSTRTVQQLGDCSFKTRGSEVNVESTIAAREIKDILGFTRILPTSVWHTTVFSNIRRQINLVPLYYELLTPYIF
jgi:hypothetical protein